MLIEEPWGGSQSAKCSGGWMKGFVEAIGLDQICGWAFDPLFRAGAELKRTVANIHRQDLASAGIGRGDHGFAIGVDQNFKREFEFKDIEVIAYCGNSKIKLDALETLQQGFNLASNAEMPVADEAQFPVFIFGPARSGTSALTLALLQSGCYEGFGEGHLLSLAQNLLQTVHGHYRRFDKRDTQDTLIHGVSARVFERMIRRGFVQLTRSVFPTGYWLDKTPTVEMVRAAPLMRELYPNARFIFLKRRVLENIASRKRKFPHEPLENHYMDWVGVLKAWLDVRSQLSDVCIEIDQIDIANFPDIIAAQIGEFLGISDENFQIFRKSLGSNRPEQTSERIGEVLSIKSLNLTKQEEETVIRICDPVMAAYGYEWGSNYYLG
jgi:hypothetical protein